jgi:hypothetical protein
MTDKLPQADAGLDQSGDKNFDFECGKNDKSADVEV